ncbi:monovalent cation/H(+) antiporter subunit G [Advenella kashmirensis]
MMDTLSPWIVIPASALIVISGLLVLIASIGMVRVSSFLPRTHIQAVIYSTALWSLLLASLLLTFSLKDRTFLHEILIGVFIFITSPVSTILLVRSFVLREERASALGESVTAAATPTVDASEEENDRMAASDVASIEAELEMEPDQDQDQDQDQKNEPDVQATRPAGPSTDLPQA